MGGTLPPGPTDLGRMMGLMARSVEDLSSTVVTITEEARAVVREADRPGARPRAPGAVAGGARGARRRLRLRPLLPGPVRRRRGRRRPPRRRAAGGGAGRQRRAAAGRAAGVVRRGRRRPGAGQPQHPGPRGGRPGRAPEVLAAGIAGPLASRVWPSSTRSSTPRSPPTVGGPTSWPSTRRAAWPTSGSRGGARAAPCRG